MTPLLVTLFLVATPADRLFAELDVGLPGRPATAVAISPQDDRIILAGVEGLLFRSSDGGATWDLVLRTSAQTVLPVEDQLSIEDSAEEAAEEADNGGASAADFEPELADEEVDQAMEDLEEDIQETLAADRESGVDVALPEGDLDVGTDDVRITLPQELPGIRSVEFLAPSVVYVATHRGLFRSVDAGLTFLPLGIPRQNKLRDVRAVCVAPEVPTFIIAATAGGTLFSRDGGVTFDAAPAPVGSAPSLSCAVGNGANPVVAIGTPFGMAVSTDGAASFHPVLLPGEGTRSQVRALTIDRRQQRIYAATPNLLYAGQAGARTLAPVGAAWRDNLYTLHTERARPGWLWAAGRQGVFVSANAGRTAQEVSAESMVRDVVDIAVGTQDPELIIVATSSGLLALRPPPERKTGPSPRHLLELLMAQEPTAVETAEWAVVNHSATPSSTGAMLTRARLSALGPRVTLTAVPVALQRTDVFVVVPPQTLAHGVAVRHDWGVLGTAQWNLDRLAANPDEALVRREHRRLLTERERVFGRVLKTYEARRRLQIDLLLHAPRNQATLLRKRLRLDELTAALDAQTGGRFTLEARRRGAPGDGVSVSPQEGPNGKEQ